MIGSLITRPYPLEVIETDNGAYVRSGGLALCGIVGSKSLELLKDHYLKSDNFRRWMITP